MKLVDIQTLWNESPYARDTTTKDAMLANLSTIIGDFKDLRALIVLYPTARRKIREFIFKNPQKFFKSYDDARELIDIYPELKESSIRQYICQNHEIFFKNLADARQQIALYPDERRNIRKFIFDNPQKFFKSYDDAKELIDIYPEFREHFIRQYILEHPEVFFKNIDDAKKLIALYSDLNDFTKDHILRNLSTFLKNANDYKALCELHPDVNEYLLFQRYVMKHPYLLSDTPEQAVAPAPFQRAQPESTSNINMQVLSGFITALGLAEVAIAFTLFNAAALGTGLVVAGLGTAIALAGMGLFALNPSRSESEPPALLIGLDG